MILSKDILEKIEGIMRPLKDGNSLKSFLEYNKIDSNKIKDRYIKKININSNVILNIIFKSSNTNCVGYEKIISIEDYYLVIKKGE